MKLMDGLFPKEDVQILNQETGLDIFFIYKRALLRFGRTLLKVRNRIQLDIQKSAKVLKKILFETDEQKTNSEALFEGFKEIFLKT